MRKWIEFVLMGMLLLTGMTVSAEEEAQPVKVMGFLYDKCGNCGVTVDKPGCGECTFYMEIFGKMKAELQPLIDSGDVVFDLSNVQMGIYRPEYFAYCHAFGVTADQEWIFPHYFIGAPEYGMNISGLEAVDHLYELVEQYIADLPEGGRTQYPQDEVNAFAETLDIDGTPLAHADAAQTEEPAAQTEETADAAEDGEDFYRNDDLTALSDSDTKIVYVYKPDCEFCAKVKPLLEGLPDNFTLPDGTSSRVVFVSLNKDDYDQYQIVKQYYDALEIPEDHRYSPLLIVGDKYYMGYDEIVPNLMNALMAGDGVSTDLSPVLEVE